MPDPQPAKSRLLPGDEAPLFSQATLNTKRYAFGSAAGRYLVLCFYGSAADPHSVAALQEVMRRSDLFDDAFASFFGVTQDTADTDNPEVVTRIPGIRNVLDFDYSVAQLYGVLDGKPRVGIDKLTMLRQWVVIDPGLRIIRVIPFAKDRSDIVQVMACLDALPAPDMHTGIALQAPILYLPNVFEPTLCQHLIDLYEADGGEESGFMREVNGRTVGVSDHSFKSRRDFNLEDKALINLIHNRIRRRVIPQVHKAHQFTVTRMERNIVAYYSAADGGHFAPHRDNTTKGTAHRRFAVSINLNDDFEGGEVSFPEYGTRGYKAPQGGAVVFSCSMLHKVSRVTQGKRYAFLPFLYDEAAARIRDANRGFIDEGVSREPQAG
jgi:peroxiredoxin/predicted 2-oxoglutarate/Fe(II)-dependent dioxygenase YbiX